MAIGSCNQGIMAFIEARRRAIFAPAHQLYAYVYTQSDQKVSVHLLVTIQKSGAQRLFDHPVYITKNA